MKIKYLGHSAFIFCGNFSVICDPFDKIGYPMNKQTADFCLCSHSHFDHNATHLVDCKYLITGENIDSGNLISLKIIPSYHDEFSGAKRGKNYMYKFVIDDMRICHMGDYGEKDFSSLSDRIGEVDVLLLPVGGKYTVDENSALKIINIVKPKICIPMHYKTARSNIDIKPLDEFLTKNKNKTVFVPSEFELSKNDFNGDTVVLIPDSENM